MKIIKVIAVVLAVFLHHGNGRAVTTTSNDNTERMLDLAEEELNTVLNEMTTEREENAADVLRLSEADSSSHEVVQSQFSSDKPASPLLRQKRSHVGPCHTGLHQTVTLESGGVATFPICLNISLTGCASSIAKFGIRKCEGVDFDTVNVRLANGATEVRVFPRNCSCAV